MGFKYSSSSSSRAEEEEEEEEEQSVLFSTIMSVKQTEIERQTERNIDSAKSMDQKNYILPSFHACMHTYIHTYIHHYMHT